jgi:predicted HicB family RNase H-like nuclease
MPKTTIDLSKILDDPSPETAPAPEPATKRLSVSVTPTLYKQLRMHALDTDQSHQQIIEAALRTYLRR